MYQHKIKYKLYLQYNLCAFFRCPNTSNCSYLFTLPLKKESTQCPRCKKTVVLTDAILQMKICEEQYQLATKAAIEDQDPKRAIGLLCQVIDTLHK